MNQIPKTPYALSKGIWEMTFDPAQYPGPGELAALWVKGSPIVGTIVVRDRGALLIREHVPGGVGRERWITRPDAIHRACVSGFFVGSFADARAA